LGLSETGAAKRLAAGDTGFIFDRVFSARKSPRGSGDSPAIPDFPALVKKLGELKKIDPSAPFYCGLLVRAPEKNWSAGGERERIAAALFTLCLDSPSRRIREEAARELVRPVLEAPDAAMGEEILKRLRGITGPAGDSAGNHAGGLAGDSAGGRVPGAEFLTLWSACLYRRGLYGEIGKLYPRAEGESSWDRALILMAACRSPRTAIPEELRDFLFALPPDEAWNWALSETAALGLDLSPAEAGVLEGKTAAAQSRYSLALSLFRPGLEEDPDLFLRYPPLIAALGRAFQYGSSAGAGETAFLGAWAEKAGPAGAYFCLHYAGRIERQQKRYGPAADYFSRALKLAPDPVQADACIWYLIDIALEDKPGEAAGVIRALLPRRHSASYFSDVLDRLSRRLCAERRWKTMEELFPLIRTYGAGSVIAQYGWILGRAAQEGYIAADPKGFFSIAYGERGAPFYYRILSAIALGERLIPGAVPPPEPGAPAGTAALALPISEEGQFFLDFITFGAAPLLPARLDAMLETLSVPELREIAGAYAAGGFWAEALTLIGRYGEDYGMNPEDLLLYYPRPYRELVEKAADERGLGPELLFGLVRTESAFNAGIVSRSGAVGLTQLMDSTARDMADRIVREGGRELRGGEGPELRDPEINLYIGVFYLRYLMDHLGGPMPALIAYNGGMGRFRRWQRDQNRPDLGPPLPGDLFLETIEYNETREYGRRVLGAAAAYGYLYYGMTMEEAAAEIYPPAPTGQYLKKPS
jgi:soluble lytic murein transglycosylase